MQCTYNVTLKRVRATAIAVEKQWVLHNMRVCIAALGIQHAMPMRHIVFRGVLPIYNIFFHTVS